MHSETNNNILSIGINISLINGKHHQYRLSMNDEDSETSIDINDSCCTTNDKDCAQSKIYNKNVYVYYLKESGSPDAEIIEAKCLSIPEVQFPDKHYILNESNEEKSLNDIVVPILRFSETNTDSVKSQNFTRQKSSKSLDKTPLESNTKKKNIKAESSTSNLQYILPDYEKKQTDKQATIFVRIHPKTANRAHTKYVTKIKKKEPRSQDKKRFKGNLLSKSSAIITPANDTEIAASEEEVVNGPKPIYMKYISPHYKKKQTNAEATLSVRIYPKTANRVHKKYVTKIKKKESESQDTKRVKGKLLSKSSAIITSANDTEITASEKEVINSPKQMYMKKNHVPHNKTQSNVKKIKSKSVQSPRLLTRSVGVQKGRESKDSVKKRNFFHESQNANDVPKHTAYENLIKSTGIKLHIAGINLKAPNNRNYSHEKKIETNNNLLNLRHVKSDVTGNKYLNEEHRNPLRKQRNIKPFHFLIHRSNKNKILETSNKDINLRSVKSDFMANKHFVDDNNDSLGKRQDISTNHISLTSTHTNKAKMYKSQRFPKHLTSNVGDKLQKQYIGYNKEDTPPDYNSYINQNVNNRSQNPIKTNKREIHTYKNKRSEYSEPIEIKNKSRYKRYKTILSRWFKNQRTDKNHRKFYNSTEDSEEKSENNESIRSEINLGNNNRHSKSIKKGYYTTENSEDWLQNTDYNRRSRHHQNKSHNNIKRKKVNTSNDNLDNLVANEKSIRNEVFSRKINLNEDNMRNFKNDNLGNWAKNVESNENKVKVRNTSSHYNNNKKSKTVHTVKNSGDWLENTKSVKGKGKQRSESHNDIKHKKIIYTNGDSELGVKKSTRIKEHSRNQDKINDTHDTKNNYNTIDDSENSMENIGLMNIHAHPQNKSNAKKNRDRLQNAKSKRSKEHFRSHNDNKPKSYNMKTDSVDWLENEELIKGNASRRKSHNNMLSKWFGIRSKNNKLKKKYNINKKDSQDRLARKTLIQNKSYSRQIGMFRTQNNDKQNNNYNMKKESNHWLENMENTQNESKQSNKSKKINNNNYRQGNWSDSVASIRKITSENNGHNNILWRWFNKSGYNNKLQKNQHSKGALGNQLEVAASIRHKLNSRNKINKDNTNKESGQYWFGNAESKKRKGINKLFRYDKNMSEFNKNIPYRSYTGINEQNKDLHRHKYKMKNKKKVKPVSELIKSQRKIKQNVCNCYNKKTDKKQKTDYNSLPFSRKLMCAFIKLFKRTYIRKKHRDVAFSYTEHEKVLLKSFKYNNYFTFKYIWQQLSRIIIFICACVLWCPCLLALELCRRTIF